jgi:7-cyano-7-deazaguanine synthase
MKVVLGLSGGMDSATLLGYYLRQGAEAHCCSFLYGSKHSAYETQAASDVVRFYKERGFKIETKMFDLRQAFQAFQSNLLKSGGEIPEGHYNDASMSKTVVPGRNLVIAAVMAGYAESIGADCIALGVHAGDHHIYPDCRPEFIAALEATLEYSTEGRLRIEAPFLYKTKTEILYIGYHLTPAVPYHLTRTCYKDQQYSCGKCGSCVERLEAFAELGLKDPIMYET